MRANSRALVTQAQACVPSSSVQTLTVRMARTTLRAGTSSMTHQHAIMRQSLHTSTSSSAEPSTSATTVEAAIETSVPPPAEIIADASITLPKWTPASRRVGLIAKKIGMTTYFLPTGERLAATVLQVSSNQISAQIGFSVPATTKSGSPISPRKAAARMAYTALQVAATNTASRRGITKQERGHLRRAGVKQDKKVLHEFKVTKDAIVPLGTQLSAAHFVPGQAVDVQAKTRGRGFQGPMKRHGFHGLRASHGVSVSHRSHGSTGQNQDPGRVFPGKKMAGRMGGQMATKQNLEVLRVDTVNDVIVVQGNVPGPEGGHVFLRDAKKALVARASNAYRRGVLPDHKGMATGSETADAFLPDGIADLPFPAGTREMAKMLPEVIEVGPKQPASAA